MLRAAERAGLRILPAERQEYRDHANVDDKLYDPRAGVGIFYRWRIRDVAALCYRAGVQPKIHLSAVERIAHGTDDYAPGNLPPDPAIVFTEPARPRDRPLLAQRAANVERVVHQAHAGRPSLLESVRGTRRLGVASYYVYLVTSTLALVTAAGNTTVASFYDPFHVFSSVGAVLFGLVSSPITTATEMVQTLVAEGLLLSLFLGGLVLAWIMATVTDTVMSRVFSQFWYGVQQPLRDGLKRARLDRRAADRGLPANRDAAGGTDVATTLRRGVGA
jgi:hypothetical protein